MQDEEVVFQFVASFSEGKTYKMNLNESNSILGAAGVGTLKIKEMLL